MDSSSNRKPRQILGNIVMELKSVRGYGLPNDRTSLKAHGWKFPLNILAQSCAD